MVKRLKATPVCDVVSFVRFLGVTRTLFNWWQLSYAAHSHTKFPCDFTMRLCFYFVLNARFLSSAKLPRFVLLFFLTRFQPIFPNRMTLQERNTLFNQLTGDRTKCKNDRQCVNLESICSEPQHRVLKEVLHICSGLPAPTHAAENSSGTPAHAEPSPQTLTHLIDIPICCLIWRSHWAVYM